MKITHIFLMAGALAFASCSSNESGNQDGATPAMEETGHEGHNHDGHDHDGHEHHDDAASRNESNGMDAEETMTWIGTYQTMASCPACDGVIKEISLKDDMTYLQSVKHHGDHIGDVVEAGRFTWTDEQEQILVISAGTDVETQYDVEGDKLIGLNDEGEQRVGEGYELYTLEKLKADQSLTGVNWVLKAIEGQELKPSDNREDAYVLFSEDGKVTGNGSCNNFNGSYSTEGAGTIGFGPMAMTKKMCSDMRVEDRFVQAIATVKTYKLHGNVLSLYSDDGAATLRFEKAI